MKFLEDHPTLASRKNNHGDIASPQDLELLNTCPNGNSWLINGGDPNYLQVLG